MDLSVQISERYRLLISDAVHIAIMKKRGIGNASKSPTLSIFTFRIINYLPLIAHLRVRH